MYGAFSRKSLDDPDRLLLRARDPDAGAGDHEWGRWVDRSGSGLLDKVSDRLP